MSERPGDLPTQRWQDWVAVVATLTSVALVVAAVVVLSAGRWTIGVLLAVAATVVAAVPVTLVRRFTREQRTARERMWERLRDDLAPSRPRFRLLPGRVDGRSARRLEDGDHDGHDDGHDDRHDGGGTLRRHA